MLPSQCTAGHRGVSVLNLVQKELYDGLLLLLHIQVVGIQHVHH